MPPRGPPKPAHGPGPGRVYQLRRRPNINSTHKVASTFQILTFGAVGMAVVLALLPAAGHDQLWFLLMAERWLRGAALYGPEAFDSNTPAIVWLSALPVALAGRLHISLPCMAKLMMTLLEAAIAACSWRVLGRLPIRLSSAGGWYLAFAFVALFAVAPARDFGQRDLIAALLCLPYILVAAQPLCSWRMRLLTAAFAAVGVCTKPQIALIPIAVELAALLLPRGPETRGRLRFEPLVLLAGGTVFLVSIHLFAPLYLSQALPTTLATYWAIGHLGLAQLIGQSIQLSILLAVVVMLLAPALRTRSEAAITLRPVLLLLTVAGLAGVLAYYQQATGWYYQQLPAITLLGAALALELLVLVEHIPFAAPNWLPGAAAGLSGLAVALTLHFSGYPITEQRAYAIRSPDPSFFAGLAPGTPVATLTTSVDDAIEPVFRYHLTWAQRTDNLWTLPAILRASSPTATVRA
ncbi:MAG TPA: hypothetical protein VGU23_04050, partial [Acidobacteriaceae bacterium]|nr:hypothetical protein [Acidobacteriaceae bacterium]